jgi:hypothetical protein
MINDNLVRRGTANEYKVAKQLMRWEITSLVTQSQPTHLPPPPSEVSGETQSGVRRDKNQSEISHAEFPAEAPESNSDECETRNAQQSMSDLSVNFAKQLAALAETHESGDRPNNQRATDEQPHGNLLCACSL